MSPQPNKGAGRATLSFRHGDETYDVVCFATPLSQLINQVILNGQTYPPIELAGDVRVVLDVGANVGASTLYFSVLYPDAEIYAFEPASEPFALLEQNTASRANVHRFNYGLYSRDVALELYEPSSDCLEASVASGAEGAASESVMLRSVRDWLADTGITTIDILKVDTEGCELPILEAISELLPSVKLVHVEYHSEDDRKAIDRLLGETHVIAAGRVLQVHRGELSYMAKTAFPLDDDWQRDAISVDI